MKKKYKQTNKPKKLRSSMNNWGFSRCLLNLKTTKVAVDLIDWGLSDEGVDWEIECQYKNFLVRNSSSSYTHSHNHMSEQHYIKTLN